MATQSAHDSPRPAWWTDEDDDGSRFPPGFVSLFVSLVGDGVRATFRTSRKKRTFVGDGVRIEGGELVVRPARRGKVEADALRAAFGDNSDVVVRVRAIGRPKGWRAVEEDVGRVARCRLVHLLAGQAISRRAACRIVAEYEDRHPKAALRRVEALQQSCLRWVQRAGANGGGQ